MRELLESNPIIGAIKNEEGLQRVLHSDCEIVFILNGDMLSLKENIEKLQRENKKVFIHIDMISGLSSSPIIIDYIKKEFKDIGIITTKVNIVKRCIDLDIDVIQRFFFIDSISLENAVDSLKKIRPKAIEIMPGVIPKIINKIHNIYPNLPIICGGLIDEKEEIINALKSGAMSVSTSDYKKW